MKFLLLRVYEVIYQVLLFEREFGRLGLLLHCHVKTYPYNVTLDSIVRLILVVVLDHQRPLRHVYWDILKSYLILRVSKDVIRWHSANQSVALLRSLQLAQRFI